ncbi:MAG: alpha/beta hydrolase fold domain-containing protein [Pseudohongiellaceae bacterium]
MRAYFRLTRNSSLCALLLVSLVEAAENSNWTIDSRSLPLPAAASDALSSALTSLPAPNIDASSQYPASADEWRAFIDAADATSLVSLELLEQTYQVDIEQDEIDGVSVYRVTPAQIAPEHQDQLFFHVHGGAYVLGGGDNAVKEAVQVAVAAGIRALSVDYRMPPESPFPAAVDDTINVYQEALQSYAPEAIAIGGTSTGGGLSLAAVHRMKQLDLPLPAAVYAGTPWSDMTKTSDTLYTNEGIDRVLVTYDGLLKGAAEIYAAGTDMKDPLISPVYGDFTGFPPTILITGTRDLFLSDTVRVHRKMRNAGVVADLHVFEGMSHAEYLIVLGSAESTETFAEVSRFFKMHLE